MFRSFRTLLLIALLVLASKFFVGKDTPAIRQPIPSIDVRPSSGQATSSEEDVSSADATDELVAIGSAHGSDSSSEEPDGVGSGQAVKMYVDGSKVNLRDAPSLKGKTLGQLVDGTAVLQIAQVDGWSEIQTPLGRGWMATRFLSSEAPAADRKAERTRLIAAPSPAEISKAKAEIIRQSIEAYPGSCPCPYNSDRAGRRCGGRSAWSKPGGYSPICYESDISDERLETYLARLRGAVD